MNRRFSRLLTLRWQATRGRLLCRFLLPHLSGSWDGVRRELVLVASATPPYLRCLTLLQRPTDLAWGPDEPPRAA